MSLVFWRCSLLVSLKQAASLLNQGLNVAVPTETVYGLAASTAHEKAISNIYRLKKRPLNNPLIVHVNELNNLQGPAKLLAEAFWPGPLTLVLPVEESAIPSIVRSGLLTCAFRSPSHPLTQELIQLTGPLVMPSANLSGRPSSTRPEHVETDFGIDFPVLDGGPTHLGVESTIVTLKDGQAIILRLGALSQEEIATVVGYHPMLSIAPTDQPTCPGQLYRHYSPKAKLILAEEFPRGSVVLGFQDRNYPDCTLFSLGASNDPKECLRNLYHLLRTLDQEGISNAYVDIRFLKEGLFATLKERLERASYLE